MALRSMIAPKTTRAARLYRLARESAQQEAAAATAAGGAAAASSLPSSEGQLMTWVNAHMRRDADMRLSKEEEQLREAKIPLAAGDNNFVSNNEMNNGSAMVYREFPMFPGEYVPAGHNTLSSVRDELRMDLAAQSLKDAWMRVSGGSFFRSSEAYFSRIEGIDEHQIGEIVAACLPGFNHGESTELVSRVLETLSSPNNDAARQLNRTVSAEALGLDNAPGHYSNFLEWMGRITETKAFQTENALFQFTRRQFNQADLKTMNENLMLMSKATLAKETSDGYSHFYSILKDFATRHAAKGTRAATGVRIDPAEIDPETGIAIGYGFHRDVSINCYIRENRDGTGQITFMGKPIDLVLDNKSWVMENILWPFDEAQIDYRDFDVYFMNVGAQRPSMADERTSHACRLALSIAISKLLPVTRITLKKAGLLSVDVTTDLGTHTKFSDGIKHPRRFAKR